MYELPHALALHRKDGVDSIGGVADVTTIPSEGYTRIAAEDEIGGDLTAAIFPTEKEADAFQVGFNHACLGDDVTCIQEHLQSDGKDLFVVLIHFGDSSDDEVRVFDFASAA